MRTIERSRRFKRDYRREKSGIHGKKLDALLADMKKRPLSVEFPGQKRPYKPLFLPVTFTETLQIQGNITEKTVTLKGITGIIKRD